MSYEKVAAILDLDGVIIDTDVAIRQAFRAVLGGYGVVPFEEDESEWLSNPLASEIDRWNAQYKTSIDLGEFSREALTQELSILGQNPPVDPALPLLLADLRAAGFLIAVATMSTRSRAEDLLGIAAVIPYLSAITTVEDVSNPKPDPEVFLKAAALLGVEPSNCVVVDDSLSGLIAARVAGMHAIWKSRPGLPAGFAMYADWTVSSLSELSAAALLSLLATPQRTW